MEHGNLDAGAGRRALSALKGVLDRQWVRFAIVGTTSLVVPFALSAWLRLATSLSDQTIFAISSVIAIELNYLLNHFFTWRKTGSLSSLAGTWMRFHITKTFTFLIGQVLFFLANALTGQFFIAYALTVLMMTFANFGLQKHYIFK